jgi:hypothetical protein
MALLVLLLVLTVGGMSALPVLNSNGLSWDTSAAQQWQAQRTAMEQTRQREETARTIAREREATERNAAMMLTLQVMAVAGMVGAAVMVGVTQWGRTARHRDTQRTEQVRLCMAYVAHHYLPGADVEVRTLPGRGVVVVDHDTQEVTPYAIVQRVMQLPAVRREGDY